MCLNQILLNEFRYKINPAIIKATFIFPYPNGKQHHSSFQHTSILPCPNLWPLLIKSLWESLYLISTLRTRPFALLKHTIWPNTRAWMYLWLVASKPNISHLNYFSWAQGHWVRAKVGSWRIEHPDLGRQSVLFKVWWEIGAHWGTMEKGRKGRRSEVKMKQE